MSDLQNINLNPKRANSTISSMYASSEPFDPILPDSVRRFDGRFPDGKRSRVDGIGVIPKPIASFSLRDDIRPINIGINDMNTSFEIMAKRVRTNSYVLSGSDGSAPDSVSSNQSFVLPVHPPLRPSSQNQKPLSINKKSIPPPLQYSDHSDSGSQEDIFPERTVHRSSSRSTVAISQGSHRSADFAEEEYCHLHKTVDLFSEPLRCSPRKKARRSIFPTVPPLFVDPDNSGSVSLSQSGMLNAVCTMPPELLKKNSEDLFNSSFVEYNIRITKDMEENGISWTIGDRTYENWDDACMMYRALLDSDKRRGIRANILDSQTLGVTESLRKETVLRVHACHKKLKLSLETLHLSLFILDKCLDSFLVSSDILSDVAAVALVMASKMEDYTPLKFSQVIELNLTHEKSRKILGAIEMMMYAELDFSLYFSTPFHFTGYFHEILRSDKTTVVLTLYLLDICLFSTDVRNFPAVIVSHACVCFAHLLYGQHKAKDGGEGVFNKDATIRCILEEVENQMAPGTGILPGRSRSAMRLVMTMLDEVHGEHLSQKSTDEDRSLYSSLLEVSPEIRQFFSSDSKSS